MPMIRDSGVIAQRRRTYHYHWCRRCRRTVRTTTTNLDEILCPTCLGQIVYRLGVSNPRRLEPSPHALESLAQILDPSINQQQQRQESNENRENGPRQALVLLQFIGPDHPPRPVSPPENMFIQPVNHGEMARDDRPGPPPVPQSAIEALPLVVISGEHLKNDSSCPVCKDEFEVGIKSGSCLANTSTTPTVSSRGCSYTTHAPSVATRYMVFLTLVCEITTATKIFMRRKTTWGGIKTGGG